jgi:hypothetical protein
MDVWESRLIDEGTRAFLRAFENEAEVGVAYAEALSESFDTHLSYVPDDGIGWEITISVEDPSAEAYVSRRVADLMRLEDGWFDEMMAAAEELRATTPRTA